MPKSPTPTTDTSREEAYLARKKARQEAAAAASAIPATPRGREAWDKARTRELFDLYKNKGDEAARDELIVSHLNLVRYLAAKYKNRGETLDDLVQVGTIGLIKAIDRFEPDRGLEFTTYATPTILGEIKRHFRDKGWDIRVPRRLQELSSKVTAATDELTVKNQCKPTTDEVAEYLGVTVEDVLEAMESSKAYSVKSLDAPTNNSDDDDDATALINRYGGQEDKYSATDDRVFEETSSDNRMIIEDAIKGFSPREQEVIRMRFNEELTQVEIAEKLGISQVQVSRLLRRTLKKIKDKIDPEGDMS